MNEKKKSAYRKAGMFRGASPIVFQHAKALRKATTPAELVLWGNLKLELTDINSEGNIQ